MAENEYTIPEPTSDTYATISSHPGNTSQRGEPSESKKNGYKAATVCLGLLCVLLLASVIGLAKHNSKLIKEKNNMVTDRDQIQSGYDNLTELNVQLQSKYNKLTEEQNAVKRKLCETRGNTFDGGVCYYISTEWKNWNASRQYCRERQSDLMVINSNEKEDLVKRVTGRHQSMWLGLTDEDEEGVWMWVDGTLLTTPTYWWSNQPDNVGEEDCVVFWNGDNVGWYDKPCNENNRGICERSLLSLLKSFS